MFLSARVRWAACSASWLPIASHFRASGQARPQPSNPSSML
jgi:hypothetical protein